MVDLIKGFTSRSTWPSTTPQPELEVVAGQVERADRSPTLVRGLTSLAMGREIGVTSSSPVGGNSLDDQQFQELLGRARMGDEDAFAAIWRAFQPKLGRVARSLAGATDGDDVAAAVWIDVLRCLADFHGDVDSFRGWLFTLARRRLVDLRRHQARRPEIPVGTPFDRPAGHDPADAVATAEATEAALALIGSLPPGQAEVVLLRVVAGLDVATVGRIIGKSPGTVRVLSHRGLANLKKGLHRDADLEGESRV